MSSFFDRAKDAAEKAADVAADHTDKIDTGLDKAAEMADKATGGKYTDKIETVQDKAHDAVDQLDKRSNDGPVPRPTPATDSNLLTVRYWAAARAAAGVSEEQAAGGGSISALIDELSARHGDKLTSVLGRCSFLLDGEQAHRDPDRVLPDDGVIDVLPPFAGG